MSWREILLRNIVKQIFKNEHFLKLSLQAFVEPIELVRMTNVSRLSWNQIWDKSQNKYIAQYRLAKAGCNIDQNHNEASLTLQYTGGRKIADENIIVARMELDIIVALSWTWVETKQQIGRNWPWPLQAEFTGSPNFDLCFKACSMKVKVIFALGHILSKVDFEVLWLTFFHLLLPIKYHCQFIRVAIFYEYSIDKGLQYSINIL